jgi:hypothetical protein
MPRKKAINSTTSKPSPPTQINPKSINRTVLITHANIIDNQKQELSKLSHWENFFWENKEYEIIEQVTDPTGKLIFDYSFLDAIDNEGNEIKVKVPTPRTHKVKKNIREKRLEPIYELRDIKTTEKDLLAYLLAKQSITINKIKFRFTRFEGWIPEFEILVKNDEQIKLKIKLFY